MATLNGGVGYQDASWLQGQGAKYPVPIRIELAPGDKRDLTGILALKVRSQSGQLVRVSELVSRRDEVAPATSCTRTCSPW